MASQAPHIYTIGGVGVGSDAYAGGRPSGHRRAVAGASCVLLDFDGPVCELFASLRPAAVAEWIRERLADQDEVVLPDSVISMDDPLDLLELAAQHSPAGEAHVEQLLGQAELECARLATPTPGARAFLEACAAADRSVVIVSNNSEAAIGSYLAREDLERFVLAVAGRDPSDASRMKPDPFLVRQALDRADCAPADAVLIGDSVSDLQAATRAGVAAIGLANKPGKRERLAAADACMVVTAMSHLTDALSLY